MELMTDFSTADLAQALSLAAEGTTESTAEARRSRLRFSNFEFERTPTGRVTARVELEWNPGESVVGRSDGIATPLGDIRISVDATLRAIESFAQGSVTFELIGVKTMRAFDANVVMVSVLANTGSETHRLLGCQLTDDDVYRGAVVATLQATNRVLGNAINTR